MTIEHPGAWVRRYREKLDMPMREWARMMGISASYLSDVERGLRPVSFQLAQRLHGMVGSKSAKWFAEQQFKYDWQQFTNRIP